MAAPKKVSPQLVEKIGTAYIRLSKESDDEGEIRRKINGFTMKALSMLGFRMTAEKMEERSRKLADVAIKRAKQRILREQYIIDLKVGGPQDGYTIEFLPDVRIDRTPENEERWRDFLGTLAPKTRIGTDPVTGEIGVLFRDGEWLGDLMLADEMHSFTISPDVKRVRGDLLARGAFKVNTQFTHEVEIMGGLHIHHELLRQDPPRITYHGPLRLYGLKSLLDVPIPPERLEAWGVELGKQVIVRSDHLEYALVGDDTCALPDGQEKHLRGLNVLSSYNWRKNHWVRTKLERIDPVLFADVHARLNRFCLIFGLGQDMIAQSVSRTPDNIERIALYLDLCLTAPGDAEQEARSAAMRIIEGLAALREPFMEKCVDAKAVNAALEFLEIEDAEEAAKLATLPRPKLNEKRLRADLALVTHMADDEMSVDDFFGNGLGTAHALYLASRSEDARANLLQAFRRLGDVLEKLSTHLAAANRPSFADLLARPNATRDIIRKGLAARGESGDIAQLDAELREVRSTAPKSVFRQITHVPFESEDETFRADRALLRVLYETRTMAPDNLDIDADRMLGLVLPRLKSCAQKRLSDALAAMRGSPAASPATDMLVSRLDDLVPGKLLPELRAWLRSLLAVARMYNSLTVSDESAKRDQERARKEMAMATLPVHAMRNISARLSRTCLLWGLGRGFLEGVDATMDSDIERIIYYLNLVLGRTEAKRGTLLKDEDLALADETVGHFKTLRNCLDTADAEAAEAALSGLGDAVLQRMADVLAKPRHPVETFALRKDREYLDGLKDTQLSLQKVFRHSGLFLLCVNSCLQSKEIRRAASTWIKPLYFGLTKLGRNAGGVTVNDLLRTADAPEQVMERIKPAADAKALEKISKTLDKIRAKSTEEIISELRKSGSPDAKGELGEDYAFLGRVLALPGTPLGTLQINAEQTCKLLTGNMESHMVHQVKTLYDSGQLQNLPSKRIVHIVLERLDWELKVIRAYNKLSNRPR